MISVRKSPKKEVVPDNADNVIGNCKITEEDKKKFVNHEIWDSIVSSLDKSPPVHKRQRELTPKTPVRGLSVDDGPELVEPKMDKVTEETKAILDKLAELYNYYIDKHFAPNVLVEMYLILQLFTVNSPVDESSVIKPKSNLFGNVHNCVYFASRVLKKQYKFILSMDRVTQMYLFENPRLDTFCPDVRDSIEVALKAKRERMDSTARPLNDSSSTAIDSVRFQSETDNRATFPDNQTFQDFKKQRDLFYEIFRNWKFKDSKNNVVEGQFATSVTRLLTLQEHPVNLSHFAKLFTDQLVTSCLGESSSEVDAASNLEDEVTKDLTFLSEIKTKMEPAKWRNLQARLMMPSQFGGPCPLPSFSGCQEFFKEFILVGGGHHGFIAHLTDTLANVIVINNDTLFDVSDEEETSSKVKNDISITILSLRICAKFLALVETLPYRKCSLNDTEDVLRSQLKIRRNPRPILDLSRMLKDSCKQRRTIITLPWIIEYCSILDPINARSNYFRDIFTIMVHIYK